MAKKQTPYGEIDVDANGTIIDSPATRAALEAARASSSETAGLTSRGEGSGGYTPDYQNLIQSDPTFGQLRSDLGAQAISDAANRQAGTSRALQQFGEVPDLQGAIQGLGLDPNSPMYRMLFGDVNAATRAGAADMTRAGLSTTAQLQRNHQVNIDNLLSGLAARGSVRSGATDTGLGMENTDFLGKQFSARNSLLDYLSGIQAAFNQSEQGRTGQLAAGLDAASTRQLALHPYVAPEPGSAELTGAGGSNPYGTVAPPPPPPPTLSPMATPNLDAGTSPTPGVWIGPGGSGADPRIGSSPSPGVTILPGSGTGYAGGLPYTPLTGTQVANSGIDMKHRTQPPNSTASAAAYANSVVRRLNIPGM